MSVVCVVELGIRTGGLTCRRLTWITGAMQLVVHDAAVQMTCDASSLWSLTPTTTLRTEGSLTGAETTTRFTPHTSRYGCSFSTVRKTPAES